MKAVTGHKDENEVSALSRESLYRTRWLMAHNRLHAIVHDSAVKPAEVWADYLKELKSAEEIAQTSA